MNKIICLSVLAGILSLPVCLTAQKFQAVPGGFSPVVQTIIAGFEKQLEEEHAKDTVGSLSAAVFIGDKIAWANAFGKADNEKGIDAGAGTVYRIGSISKTFTAYLMMLLVQDGVIKLDDPVAKYLPEVRQLKRKEGDTAEITFRELASHTGGLAREPGLTDAAAGPIEEWENKVLSSIPTTDVSFAPGTKFFYSNIGYGILGLALSRAAHKPFMELVQERIFKPLHMNSSFYIIPVGGEGKVAAGYHQNNASSQATARQAAMEFAGRGYKVPNGGVYSTPMDLARFVMALYSDSDRLARKYREMMQTIQTPESRFAGYGFGLSIYDGNGGLKLVGHDGAVAGFLAFMLFSPGSKVGVIVMRNYDFDAGRIPAMMRKVVEGLAKAAAN